MPSVRITLGAAVLAVLLGGLGETRAAEKAAAPAITFEQHIRPILKANCFHCHGEEGQKENNLDLRLARLALAGGKHGPAITPGKASESRLFQYVRDKKMPPEERPKLTAAQVELIGKWIDAGAPTVRPEPTDLNAIETITELERQFWSFQPVVRPAIPVFDSASGVQTPIDALLLDRMKRQDKRLGFSPQADRRSLMLRVYMDLTGLPPTAEQVAAFEADPSPAAYEALVDRLLASPHLGERWARHWLDVAGYADSEGNGEADAIRPDAWRYRDYVIQAFNAGKPYDQFLREQLAGDELAGFPGGNLTPDRVEKLTATGFLRMAADGTAGGSDQATAANQTIADTLNILGTSVLGLSVGCAQCHDHRYDPIPQKDYYQLRAVFEPAFDAEQWRRPQDRRVSLYTDADRAKAAQVEAEAAKVAAEKKTLQEKYMAQAFDQELAKHPMELREPLRLAYTAVADKRTAEQKELLAKYPSVNINPGVLYQYNQKAADELKQFDERIAKIRAGRPPEHFVRALAERPGRLPPTRLLHRGDHRQPKDAVVPASLSITDPPGGRMQFEPKAPDRATSGRRLALSNWLTDPRHPLTARVMANRIWLHHFGKGIVATPNDFGSMGSRPTHPELLDWLASELAGSGWEIKRLQRIILLSAAYRQSSQQRDEAMAIDPSNELYWRMQVRRLDAEAVRDRMLSASGTINGRMHGGPVPVKEDAVGQIVVGIDEKGPSNTPGKEIPLGIEQFRRSIYIQVRRSKPLAALGAFDLPVMVTNCDMRKPSTSPTQALLMMNSDLALQQAWELARGLTAQVGLPAEPSESGAATGAEPAADPRRLEALVDAAWRAIYLRKPDDAERRIALAFMTAQLKTVADQRAAAPVAPPAKDKKAPKPVDPAQAARKLAQTDELRILTNLCQTLLGSNEFLYLD